MLYSLLYECKKHLSEPKNQSKKAANVELFIIVNIAKGAKLMIRFYSLFVTDEAVVPSPYPFTQRFNPFHDLTLQKDKPETINFLLQTTLDAEQYDKMNVLFDPEVLEISHIEVRAFSHQTLTIINLTPKQAGSLRIGFAFPQSAHLHRTHLKRVLSPFISLPCKYFSPLPKEKEAAPHTAWTAEKKPLFVET